MEEVNLIKKHKHSLISHTAIKIFLFEYPPKFPYIIEEMKKESPSFDKAWDNIKKDDLKITNEDHEDEIVEVYYPLVYKIFLTELNLKDQALFLDKIMNAYEQTAKEDVEHYLKIKK